jgi:hypothetical protein
MPNQPYREQIEYFGPNGRIDRLGADKFKVLRKGMMTTVTGRIIDSGPDWVTIQSDWRGGVLESTRVLDIDFAALERRIYDFECFGFNEAPAIRYLDLFTPVEPSLPQEVIDSRPKPVTILMEINRVSYTGHSEQAEPWRGRVRTARHPVGAVRGRGPRRERW